MQTIVSLIGISGLSFCLFFFFRRQSGIDRTLYSIGLAVKLLAGLALGWVYKYYYDTGDTFALYEQASELSKLLFKDPGEFFSIVFIDTSHVLNPVFDGQPRALLFVKVLSTINVFAFDSYWVTSVYISSLSFLCASYLVKKIATLMPEYKAESFIAFLFLPSYVFWSSGVVKESVAMMSLCFLAGVVLAFVFKSKLKFWEWIVALVSVVLSWQLKYYWAGLFFICSGSCIVTTRIILVKWPGISKFKLLLIWAGVIAILSLVMSLVRPNFNLDRFLFVVVENHDVFVKLSAPSDLISYSNLEPSWASVLINSPIALVAGLFRPFIFEATTIFQALASIENLFMLVLTFISVYHLRRERQTRYYIISFSLLAYCLLLSVFLSLSTPNFGTLSRYRTGFLPFFAFLVLCQSKMLHGIRTWIMKLR